MSDLDATRRNIQLEESQFRAAVSEGALQKIGSSINFINKRQFDTKTWEINGPYDATGTGGVNGVDGMYICPHDCEIVGVVMYNIIGGSSGSTSVNVTRYTSPGTSAGNIFSTDPDIDSTATDYAYVGFSISDDGTAVSIGGGTGMTEPVLTSFPFQLDQGDALVLNFADRMAGGENCGLHIFMRPR